MCISVKCQLAVVTVDSDIAGVSCNMPHVYTNAEYADMLYVYSFCSASATADYDREIFENVLYFVT